MIKGKINNLSIKRINFVLFFLMFYFFFFTLIFDYLYNYKIFVIILNFILFILFLLFNYFYTKEFKKSKEEIVKVLKDNKNDFLKSKHFYSENKDTNNLFKKFIINKNLQNKDFKDLENVLYKFTPEYFVHEVFKKGIDRAELGISIKKDLHIMFLDIIGFTSITEKLTPERSLLLLNIYFDGIVEIIKKHNGIVDKFLGDGILIIFDCDNSDNILNASIEIQKFIKKFRISEIGKNITIGIGINSGKVIMGTIGSNDRMEVTIIGDTVNTASRIEGLTRKTKDKIIISEDTYMRIKEKKNFNINDLGEKNLKGKKTKKRIYGIDV